MKLIIAFALIVATSCDVSHIVQGNGWFKDASGYHYNKPETRFTEEVAVEEIVAADVPAIEEPLIVAEPESVITDEVVEQIIGSDEPVSVEVPFETPVEAPVEEVVVADEQTPIEVVEPEIVAEVVADPIIEVVPEVKVNEYLPPVDAKKKRQIPVRRVIRKVYRRFVPIKRH